MSRHFKNGQLVGTVIVECATCGKRFVQNRHWQKYCGPVCYPSRCKPVDRKLKLQERICKICGANFMQNTTLQIYCSVCRNKSLGCSLRRACYGFSWP